MGSFLRKRDDGLEDLHEAMAASSDSSKASKLLEIANSIGLVLHETKVQLKQQISNIDYYRTGRGFKNDLGQWAFSKEESDKARDVQDEMRSFLKTLDAFSSKIVGMAQSARR
jgi:hypothetical protein